MPKHPISVIELHNEYTSSRKIELSYQQFISFVLFFPALLVVATDGKVDDDEWDYIENLAMDLVRTFENDTLSPQEKQDLRKLFIREFCYLLDNFDTWERKFTKSLKLFLYEHAECREKVLSTIHHSAEVSEGICEKEKIMIEYLIKELGMDEGARCA